MYEEYDRSSVNSSGYESELSKVKKRFSKLTVAGGSYNNLLDNNEGMKSPRSLLGGVKGKDTSATGSNLKKRRYR